MFSKIINDNHKLLRINPKQAYKSLKETYTWEFKSESDSRDREGTDWGGPFYETTTTTTSYSSLKINNFQKFLEILSLVSLKENKFKLKFLKILEKKDPKSKESGVSKYIENLILNSNYEKIITLNPDQFKFETTKNEDESTSGGRFTGVI